MCINSFNCFSVSSYSDWRAEVKPVAGMIVCLCLTTRTAPQRYGSDGNTFSVPTHRVTLDLQAFTLHGELAWISQSITVQFPELHDGQAKVEAMKCVHRLVAEDLATYDVQIRRGLYLTPDGHMPVNGCFDNVEWYKDDAGHLAVRPSND